MFHRGYRGFRRKSGPPRPFVQTFKKVLNFLEASLPSGFTTELLVSGIDGVALHQSTNVDAQVPTGSKVKFIEVQFVISNLVSIHCYINCSLQLTLAGQGVIDPQAVGGNSQRNQVFHQDLFVVGADQNSTHKFRFKIPKGFQRMREGMKWNLVWSTNQTVNRAVQVIYKVEQ